MSSESEERFTVHDRRPRFEEDASSPPPTPSPSQPQEGFIRKEEGPPSREPISFTGFILSLGTSALIHLGDEVDPATGKKEFHLDRAREVIDLLSVLEEKTKGNLLPEEQSLMSRLLFTLRMRYIESERRKA